MLVVPLKHIVASDDDCDNEISCKLDLKFVHMCLVSYRKTEI